MAKRRNQFAHQVQGFAKYLQNGEKKTALKEFVTDFIRLHIHSVNVLYVLFYC